MGKMCGWVGLRENRFLGILGLILEETIGFWRLLVEVNLWIIGDKSDGDRWCLIFYIIVQMKLGVDMF